jgi:hypothetical protein
MESLIKRIDKIEKGDTHKFSNEDFFEMQQRVFKLEKFLSDVLEFPTSKIKKIKDKSGIVKLQ